MNPIADLKAKLIEEINKMPATKLIRIANVIGCFMSFSSVEWSSIVDKADNHLDNLVNQTS